MRSAVLTTRVMDSDSATNKGRAGRWPLSPNPDKKIYAKTPRDWSQQNRAARSAAPVTKQASKSLKNNFMLPRACALSDCPCGSFYWAPEQAASLLVPMQAPAVALMLAAASLADLAKLEVATLPTTRRMAPKTRPRQKQAASLEVSTLRKATLLIALTRTLTRTVSLLMVSTNKALES